MPDTPGKDATTPVEEVTPSLNPGDEAAPGTAGSGEDNCRDCGGSGQVNGQDCQNCGGTGRVVKVIGGA